jgi:heme/copper-type cytochrome/quinol oxidase subunit 4
MMLIIAIVIGITDTVVFIRMKDHPEKMTVPALIGVIFITILPIAINIWVHFRKYF